MKYISTANITIELLARAQPFFGITCECAPESNPRVSPCGEYWSSNNLKARETSLSDVGRQSKSYHDSPDCRPKMETPSTYTQQIAPLRISGRLRAFVLQSYLSRPTDVDTGGGTVQSGMMTVEGLTNMGQLTARSVLKVLPRGSNQPTGRTCPYGKHRVARAFKEMPPMSNLSSSENPAPIWSVT